MHSSRRTLPPLATLLPFEASCRLESFTLAAEELGLTQGAISKQIRFLEAELGVTLFERRNRGVFPTEAGRRFGRIVSDALSEIAMETQRLKARRRPGEVVLRCQLCEAFYWLMPRLSSFHRFHPDVEVRVSGSIEAIGEAAADFDIAIQTAGRRHGSYPLVFTASDEVFPVCSPSYAEAMKCPLPLSALRDERLLAHRVEPQDWMDWDDFLRQSGSMVRVGSKGRSFDSYPLVLQAAVSGQGIALGWRRTVASMLADGTLLRPCRESVIRPAEIAVYLCDHAVEHRREVAAVLAWLAQELA
ncbi:MAG: LysR substrate-binding domain-containing protein [Pseudomonadota bacterium]|nr:LysR substrate-binding domain-containing protein [Pseudomonadota bacterium]